ncbi:hypothetical protein D9V32_07345 [Mycetocola tolaasinivorans]|uniref:Peptidoglycan binding-like domain-containing protein n=1 Tax=Mycetocola tolaasinivorans TaxID=76635 RepID=A0A3L7A732_9MICO|nr:peptidoglycan-binding domain-containing protein [Mycetocola tolaasinivorans]RLP75967.1 hypothetical protein D9V32_07345 [Mycetocola tolaasinivorans]
MGKNRAISDGALFSVWPLTLLWFVPLLVFALASFVIPTVESLQVRADLPESVRVGSRDLSFPLAVTAHFEIDEQPLLRSKRSGMVTDIQLVEHASLTQGQRLFDLDGEPAFLFLADRPLYRDLARGDAGKDVGELTLFLADTGLLAPGLVGERFTPAVERAVKKWQGRHFLPPTGSMDHRSLLFLPRSVNALESVSVGLGDPVEAGSEIARSTARTARVEFKPVDAAGSLNDFEDAPVTAEFSGQSFVLASPLVPESEVQAFYDALLRAGVDLSDPDQLGRSLVATGIILRVADPRRVAVAPATTVHVSSTGRQCVFLVPEEDEKSPRPIAVPRSAAVIPEIGYVIVPDSLEGREILRAPSHLPTEVRAECE